MILRKCEKNELTILDYELVTNETVIELLSEDVSKLIYIYRDKKLFSILNKNDLPVSTIQKREHAYFIHHVDTLNYSFDEIETKFKLFPRLTRLAVIYNGDVLCEYNNNQMIIYDVVRNISALRYFKFFKYHIKKFFLKHNWKNILIISDDDIYNLIKRDASFNEIRLHKNSFLEFKHDYSDYDVIFDFKYGKNLRAALEVEGQFKDLYMILEDIALNELTFYCKRNDVRLFYIKIPSYDSISSLSHEEKEISKIKTNFNEMILNDKYLEKFCCSDEEYRFLKDRIYSKTFLIDDGFSFLQSDCRTCSLNVHNGTRCTLPTLKHFKRRLHIFGPCTAFGLGVPDDKTISSYLQDKDVFKKTETKVYSISGVYGRYFLNTLMMALNQKISKNDGIILIGDGTQDVTVLNFLDPSKWFNEQKCESDVYFLDHPAHCNSKANKLYANNIESILVKNNFFDDNSLSSVEFNYFSEKNMTTDRYDDIEVTNMSLRYYLKSLSKLISLNTKNGIIILYQSQSILNLNYQVDEALEKVDYLYIFVLTNKFVEFENVNENRFEIVKNMLKKRKNVVVVSMKRDFNSTMLSPGVSCSVNIEENIEFMEEIIARLVCKVLGVAKRFICLEGINFATKSYKEIVEKICKKYDVECVTVY